ncbi:MAG TPA: endolytic transglycosylase MltG [Solirubrobacteraceae bacterium]|nr:endolytic transglycosylase MltG [Solirubrobacteraceae bacterium]
MASDNGSNGGGQRSEEERERAREQRERRRGQRVAANPSVPPLPPPAEPVRPAEPSRTSRPAYSQAEPPPVQVEPADLSVADRPVLESPAPRAPIYGPVSTTPAKRMRGVGRRIATLLATLVLLGALGFAVVLLSRHTARPKIPPIPKIVKIVIPEGFTRAQIAVLAHQDGLSGSYLLPSKRSSEIEFAHYGAPADTPNLEGFLFPATYEMYVGSPASQLVSEQLSAFHENFGGGEVDRAHVLGITPYQLLIVASIIEREAAIPHDRPLVAAVIYNRLHRNMTLGIDSTLRYALHNFSTPLTEAELHSDSPYNTRTHTGLPPTPISNPGLAAIKAAAHPAHVSYLYYVAGADGCGEEVFSTSYARFEKNAAAYREAIAKNGGRVPTCKKG